MQLKFSAIDSERPALFDGKEIKRSNSSYVTWGSDNSFPQHLYDLYLNSSLMNSIINGYVDYILGQDIFSTPYKTEHVISSNGDTLFDVLSKCVFDYVTFGGFALQLYYKGDSEIPEKMDWVDFSKVRVNEDMSKCYISDEWGKYGKKCLEYDIWKDGGKGTRTCIFYFRNPNTRTIYPVPLYNGALRSIQTSVKISDFHLNNITHDFAVGTIISFNQGQPDDDTQNRIEKAIEEKFCGTENSGRFLLLFNESKENGIEVFRMDDNMYDKKYASLVESVRDDIFESFRATPNLFGLPTSTTGFSQQEYQDSYRLFMKTVIFPIQNTIMKAFSKIGYDIMFHELQVFNTDNN